MSEPRTYYAFGNEVILLPSITPNPQQKRIGIRVGAETVWLRPEEAIALAKAITKEAK